MTGNWKWALQCATQIVARPDEAYRYKYSSNDILNTPQLRVSQCSCFSFSRCISLVGLSV